MLSPIFQTLLLMNNLSKKMKKISSFLALLISIFLFSSFTTPTSTNWSKAYHQNGLLIYTRATDGGIKEFKAITTVNASLQTVVAVMKDYGSHPEWMKVMTKCELVKQVGAKSRYLYYAIDFPWPLSNRDMISKSTFSVNADGTVLMTMSAAPSQKPENADFVRIKDAAGYWKVKDLKNGKTEITYQYKADPDGIPSAIVNMFLLEGPKQTFEGLYKQVKLARYKNPDISWLYKD